jgi:hypothetical protein
MNVILDLGIVPIGVGVSLSPYGNRPIRLGEFDQPL